MRDFLTDPMTVSEVLQGGPFLVGASRINVLRSTHESGDKLFITLSVGPASATVSAILYRDPDPWVTLSISTQAAKSQDYMAAMLVLDWLSNNL